MVLLAESREEKSGEGFLTPQYGLNMLERVRWRERRQEHPAICRGDVVIW